MLYSSFLLLLKAKLFSENIFYRKVFKFVNYLIKQKKTDKCYYEAIHEVINKA